MTGQTALPVGSILAFAGSANSIPADWLPCDGSAIPPQYTALQDIFGSSDATTPNLIGRTLIGAGQLGAATVNQEDGRNPDFTDLCAGEELIVGATGGECFHQLVEGELPAHNHPINGGNFGTHTNSFEGGGGSDMPFETMSDDGTKFNSVWGTDGTGGDQPHYNIQPYYAVTYIIYAGTPAQT